MTTLLLSHPACLDHLTPHGPSRAAGPLARDRARAGAREVPVAGARAGADGEPRDDRARASARVRRAGARGAPKEGMVRLDADTTMSPGTFEAVLRAAGGAVPGGRRGDDAQGRQRLRRDAPARPSRRDRDADGLLPVQQCGDRGAPRAEAARRRARRDRRFRRASRQRQPGHFLERRRP